MSDKTPAVKDAPGEADKANAETDPNLVALPGEEEDDIEKGETADVNWHDFESQYSMALAQSAIVEREKWSSNIEFLLSCISSAVGLGNIWRFPFVCGKNGGGAFLIPYMIVVFIIGRPLYYLELSLGQFSSRGSVKVWEMAPVFRGIGYGTGVASFLVSTFYVTIMAWTLLYGAYSCYNPFPWNVTAFDKNTEKFFIKGILHDEPSPGGGKYDRMFKRGEGLGPPAWEQLLALAGAWIILWLALVKGVSGSGKVAYFTAIFPYVVLITLLSVGCSLNGAMDGILFFLTPKWDVILDPKTWFEAVSQCFFSLGVGFGGAIMFSSYNHFNHNLGRDVLIISIVDTITSFLAGITVFSILGNLAHTTGQKVSALAERSGPGLAFVSYPQAMTEISKTAPYPVAQILSFLFFVMLLTLGIGSATALVGTTTTIFQDEFPNVKKWIIVTINCVLGFIGGIIYTCPAGPNVIDIVNDYGAGFVIYVMAFLEICGLVFVYGLKNYCNDVEFMLGSKVGLYWVITWTGLAPLLVIIFIFYLSTYKAPDGWHWSAVASCWIMAGLVCCCPIIWAIHTIQTRKSSKLLKRFRASLYPTRRWGPKDPVIKEAWRRFRLTRPKEFALTARIKKLVGMKTDAELPIPSAIQTVGPSSVNMGASDASNNIASSEYPTEAEVNIDPDSDNKNK